MNESGEEGVRKRLKAHLGTPTVDVLPGIVHEMPNAERVYRSLVNLEKGMDVP